MWSKYFSILNFRQQRWVRWMGRRNVKYFWANIIIFRNLWRNRILPWSNYPGECRNSLHLSGQSVWMRKIAWSRSARMILRTEVGVWQLYWDWYFNSSFLAASEVEKDVGKTTISSKLWILRYYNCIYWYNSPTPFISPPSNTKHLEKIFLHSYAGFRFFLLAATGKVLGGCATVAGWGRRFDDRMEGTCKTDSSGPSPDKIKLVWRVIPVSVVHSHWSRWFIVLLRQYLLCHKEPAPRIRSPLLWAFCLLLAGSLWHKSAGGATPRNSPRHRGGPHWFLSCPGSALTPGTPMARRRTPALTRTSTLMTSRGPADFSSGSWSSTRSWARGGTSPGCTTWWTSTTFQSPPAPLLRYW